MPRLPKSKLTFSPSQRLRQVLFTYWQKNASHVAEFDTFYKNEMEKIINHFKAQL